MKKVAVGSSTQPLPLVGNGVGARVGALVGARVGSRVGARVLPGIGVGARVGAGVIPGVTVGARVVGAAVGLPAQYAGFGFVFVIAHTWDWIQAISPLVRE